ncbi:hypothetical protein [Amycolatopsis sp. EV170708-02-1]|uniref:hypothetical protein n=1 Tax=Amycolatopsis sp. EV170708-02-1 TaxID=2919322 RepID=UPI001F0CABDE|nr:hypothetical protein [Amycolatopsis sp. EV170708-02-1]UMO99960.1 hypothetical protein MJQ72_26000 [Amycolatopsis sp. EV170708-02-1]
MHTYSDEPERNSRMPTPYRRSETGLPCYRPGAAPPFLRTTNQLEDMGLCSTGRTAAFVDSQYGPAALFLLTETDLLPGTTWPPIMSAEQTSVRPSASG